MAFCKFSSEYIISNSTSVDNLFINEFLPYADANYTKVYLYGLYKASDSASYDNTLESFSKVLKLSQEEILTAFKYWESEGLLQIINITPIEIRYLPVRNIINNIKKFNKNKYSSFNGQIQEIIEGRMITPNEYAEYYTVIEAFHMEPEALLMVAKYCTNLKGTSLGYPYITTIAKKWAHEGITTVKQVEEKLLEQERSVGKLKDILSLLKITRDASLEERQQFIKWQKEFKFDYSLISFVAKRQKGKYRYDKLDNALTKYYNLGFSTEKEIENYEETKESLFELTKSIIKKLGLFYESLDNIIEIYTSKWLKLGFSEKMLLDVADLCLKQNIRTLEGMDNKLNQFYKLGILTETALADYIGEIISTDKTIQGLLDACGIHRVVNSFDRSMYRTWSYSWGFTDDIIKYACEISKNAVSPMQYASKILSAWNNSNLKTLKEVQNFNTVIPEQSGGEGKKPAHNYHQKDYSKQELDALFDNLNEVLDYVKK